MNVGIGGFAVALGIGAALAAAAPASADDDGGAPPQSARSVAAAHSARSAPNPAATTASATTAANKTARAATSQPKVSPWRQSRTAVRSGKTGAAELSGITYAGGSTYYAVGDNGADQIWQVDASLNTNTGRIRSARVTTGLPAPDLGRDSEGIALTPSGTSVWVADEIASSITEFSLTSGQKVATVSVPSIYRPANVQDNMGLESLTYGADKLWTANEEALRPDGSLSTTEAGSWVRIQEFDGPDLTVGKQFGYLTDPITRMSPLVSEERSGLVDLVALPNGQMLALERELGGWIPRFRSRLYLLDFSSATDVSNTPSLSDGGFTPVSKTLLWQRFYRLANFEGITVGPQLDSTSYSLVLVSDNGGGALGQQQSSVALVLKGVQGGGVQGGGVQGGSAEPSNPTV